MSECWVNRVQVRRRAFVFRRHLEDCYFCLVGGEPITPHLPGAVIPPRMAPLMELQHPFRVANIPRARNKMLSFEIVVTDQFDKRHYKRVRLPRFGQPP